MVRKSNRLLSIFMAFFMCFNNLTIPLSAEGEDVPETMEESVTEIAEETDSEGTEEEPETFIVSSDQEKSEEAHELSKPEEENQPEEDSEEGVVLETEETESETPAETDEEQTDAEGTPEEPENDLPVEEISETESEALDTNPSDFTYTENSDGTIKISKYNGAEANVVIPSQIDGKQVKSIGSSAFKANTNIVTVSVPEGVTEIGNYAFSNCTGLTTVDLPETLQSIGGWAFERDWQLKTISIPGNVTSIGWSAFYMCESIQAITIPEGVKTIKSEAFYLCANLKELSLPAGLETIEDHAFEACNALEHVDLPEGLVSLGMYAFAGSNLSSVTIPAGITAIPSYAFRNCTNLQTVNLPEGVKTIGSYAFEGNRSLRSFTIPSTVTSISSYAFRSCTNLSKVTYFGSSEDWAGISIGSENDPLVNATRTYIILPTSISLSESTLDLAVTGTKRLTFTAVPSDTSTQYFEWSSSNPEVCTVSSAGYVTAVSEGTATITVRNTYNNVQASCVVNAYITHPEMIYVIVPERVMGVGENQQLRAVISPYNSYNKEVIWSSSDESIAVVNNEGVVTGLASGTVDITAETVDGGKTDTKSITIVQYVTDLHFSEEETELVLNCSKDLDIVIGPEDAVNKTLEWSSGDENIVTVDQNGRITATGVGTAVITARTTEHPVEATILVRTKIIDVEAVHITSSEDTVHYGESITLQAEIEPEDATYKSVQWFSSDESIATVDENGVVTGVGEGQVTISAVSEYGGVTGEKAIEVLFTHLQSIQFTDEQVTLYIDETKQLSMAYEPEYASEKRVIYISSDQEIAEVTEDGQIIPVHQGTTTITAFSVDGGLTAEITVNVWLRVSGIEMAEKEIALNVPGKVTLTASILPADAGNKQIHWVSENEEVATVDENGTVTAVGGGETVVKAITDDGGFEAQCAVVTYWISPRKVNIIADFDSLLYGESASLAAEVYPANASVQEIVWSSDDPEIISVDDTGAITALKEGSTAITASTADGSVQGRKWIDVIFHHVEAIELSEEIIGLVAGETYELHPVILPENAMDTRLAYSSADENVAYVDEDGVIHPVSEGNTVITIESLDSHVSIERTVSVLADDHAASEYQIVFNGNGSTSGEMEDLTWSAGMSYTLPENRFEKESYVFSSWNTASDGSGRTYSDGERVMNLFLGNSDPVILYAQWETPNYAITYELNGGVNSELNPSVYKEADSILFEAPARTGYTFKGWYSDPKFKKKTTGVKAGSTKDLTVYAKWARNTYSVTYKLNGGKNAKSPVTKYNVDSPDTFLKDPTKKGYEFAGWYTDEFFLSRKVNMIPAGSTGNLTLYAKWVMVDYALTYVLSDGVNSSYNPQTYTRDDTVTLKAASKHGYVFKGWYSDPKYRKKVSKIKKGSAGDKTLYAKWQVNKYTITFNANGGKGKAPKKMTCKYFTEYTLKKNTFSKKGYAFISWNTEKDGSGRSFADLDQIINLTDINGGKIVLYAQWGIADYPINYFLNGGINAENNPLTYTMMSPTITFEAPTKAGYIFKGWFSDAKFKNKLTGIKTGSTGAKNAYAKWGIETYTIQYVTGGGITTNPDTYTVEDTIVFSDPTRTGYHFLGWYADAQYTTPVNGIERGTMGNQTYYAKWEGNTYYVRFDTNGATGIAPETITATYGTSIMMPAPGTMTYGDYQFRGWSLTGSGEDDVYTAGSYASDLTSVDGQTVTLYAIWGLGSAPNITSISAVSYDRLSIQYSKISGNCSGYEIYRSTSPDMGFVKIQTTTYAYYYDLNLNPNTYYYYKVRAYYSDSSGHVVYSNYSSVYSARTPKKPNFTAQITYPLKKWMGTITLVVNNKGSEDIVFLTGNCEFYPWPGSIPEDDNIYGSGRVAFEAGKSTQWTIPIQGDRMPGEEARLVISFEYDGITYSAIVYRKKAVVWSR